MVNTMSNTFNENTQLTVTETLESFIAEEQKRQSNLSCAKQALFYAEKAVADADFKLRGTLNQLKSKKRLNAAALEVRNQGANLQSSVGNNEQNAKKLVNNIATAAADVQSAALAITRVSADIGAAYNLVSASDFDTDIYHLTKHTNDFVRKTALKAEQASLRVSEASADAAEIIAKQVGDEMGTVKKGIDNFYDDINKQVRDLTELEKAEYQAWQGQSNRERSCLGRLADANKENTASIKAFLEANDQLNYSLTPHVVDSQQIQVSFTPLQVPFLHQLEADAKDEDGAGKQGDLRAGIRYFVTLVPNEKKLLFRYHEAELNFQERKSSCYVEVKPADKPEPGPGQVPDGILPGPFSSPENANNFVDATPLAQLNSIDLTKVTDSSGEAIVPGKEYVLFLYIELPQSFKKFVNNYNDLLSAPSQRFAPADKLALPGQLTLRQQETRYDITRQAEAKTSDENAGGPAIHAISKGQVGKHEAITALGDVSLECTIVHDLPDGVEYRALLLPADRPAIASQTALAEKLDKTQRPHLNFYFDQEIAELIPASNYTLGKIVYKNDYLATDDTVGYHYVFDLNDATTDICGDPIESGQVYFVVILALIDGKADNAKQFITQMTAPTDFWFVIPEFPLETGGPANDADD